MRRVRLFAPLLLFLTVSCNLGSAVKSTVPVVSVEPIVTATTGSKPTRTESVATSGGSPADTWAGKMFTLETKNLVIDYPDFIDPAEARKHADALQKAYDAYLAIFAFNDDLPFGGQKTTITWNPQVPESTAHENRIVMGAGALNPIKEGDLNPPDPIFIHEMGHVFVSAQAFAERYYIFNLIIGINESFTEYFVCHPDLFQVWGHRAADKEYCDLILYGKGDKGPEYTLAYYEAEKIDPYSLDWGSHPPGGSGEVFFRQMLARVSDKAGWDIWEKYFSITKKGGGGSAARDAHQKELTAKSLQMADPLVVQAFENFVSDLSQAAGQDLAPMFRSWGFKV